MGLNQDLGHLHDMQRGAQARKAAEAAAIRDGEILQELRAQTALLQYIAESIHRQEIRQSGHDVATP